MLPELKWAMLLMSPFSFAPYVHIIMGHAALFGSELGYGLCMLLLSSDTFWALKSAVERVALAVEHHRGRVALPDV